MNFNRELLKAIYDNDYELFSNLNLGNTDIQVSNKEIGIITLGFYRGCFRHAIKDFFNLRISLYSLETFDEWEEYLTSGMIEFLNNNIYKYLDIFGYVADPLYLKDRNLNFLKDDKLFNFTQNLIKTNIYEGQTRH